MSDYEKRIYSAKRKLIKHQKKYGEVVVYGLPYEAGPVNSRQWALQRCSSIKKNVEGGNVSDIIDMSAEPTVDLNNVGEIVDTLSSAFKEGTCITLVGEFIPYEESLETGKVLGQIKYKRQISNLLEN